MVVNSAGHKATLAIHDSNPEVIVSFMDTDECPGAAGELGPGVPVIVKEQNDPRKNPVGMIVGFLRRLLYKRACAVVVLTPGIAQWAGELSGSEAIMWYRTR